MDTVTRLRISVGLLTRPSKHRLVDPDGIGADRWMTADPLLDQLRAAVRSSSPGGSYTTSNGTPLLISAAAFDLERTIRLVVAKHWAGTRNLHHGHGKESIEAKLRTWAMVVEPDEILTAQAERYCTLWVEQIKGLLQPIRRREIRGACPQCKVARVIDHYDEEGGRVTTTALVIESSEGSPALARCLHCSTLWQGQDMWLLVHDLDGAEA